MIETESQRQGALSWIRYWNASISTGQQSWLGQEQAQEAMMTLHKQVDAYEKRVRAAAIAALPDDIQAAACEAAALERASGTQLGDEAVVPSMS